MKLSDLVGLQAEFDRRHGWTVRQRRGYQLIESASREIVGLVGEVGEFANEIKKSALVFESRGKTAGDRDLARRREALAEEVVDSFIYILRLAALLGIDLEKEHAKKLGRNEKRFRGYLHRGKPR
jgi:NTP pyrophosphatase (non-canonical NTP hydrolase)